MKKQTRRKICPICAKRGYFYWANECQLECPNQECNSRIDANKADYDAIKKQEELTEIPFYW